MTDQALDLRRGTQEVSTSRHMWWNFTDTVTIAMRNIKLIMRQPQLLVFSTVQPVMFVLLFTYVFGGAIATGQEEYINYLLPGILVQTVMFGGINTAIGLSTDLKLGLIDRFRSLPMARSAVLAGRTLADSARNLFVVILMVLVGYIIGFRFQDGAIAAIEAVLLMVLFGHVVSWIYAWLAMMVRDPEAVQAAGFLMTFPLVFASSIFVPTATMPHLLRTFAENQPISLVVNSVRGLILGTGTDDLGMALLWMLVIYLVFMPLSINQYRRSTS